MVYSTIVKALRAFVVFSLVISFASASFAQGVDENRTRAGGPRKQLATIIFAGLGGAVLGLSTLSFYGRPQDHLSNIAVGFAVGVIAGTTYVTYKAATRPQDFYGDHPDAIPRELLSSRDFAYSRVSPVKTPIFSYQLSF